MVARVNALRLVVAAIVAAAVMQSSVQSRAQPSSETADLSRAMVGQWELATAERSKTCVVILSEAPVGNGMRASIDPACAAVLPFTAEIAAWSIRGLDIVRLQNAAGDAVIDLTPVESDIFEGVRSGEGVYLLQNLEAARSLTRSMDHMIGEWAMMRSGSRRLCDMTLTNTEASGENFKAFVNAGCGAATGNFNPVMWRLERGEIVLISAAGTTWHFQADDNAQWRRVPEEPDPLMLVRQ